MYTAFDICSEDTELINAIQRQRLDILVSLRCFVTGQCSVMKISKQMYVFGQMYGTLPSTPTSALNFWDASGDVEGAFQHPKFITSVMPL